MSCVYYIKIDEKNYCFSYQEIKRIVETNNFINPYNNELFNKNQQKIFIKIISEDEKTFKYLAEKLEFPLKLITSSGTILENVINYSDRYSENYRLLNFPIYDGDELEYYKNIFNYLKKSIDMLDSYRSGNLKSRLLSNSSSYNFDLEEFVNKKDERKYNENMKNLEKTKIVHNSVREKEFQDEVSELRERERQWRRSKLLD